jgi:hypothetical protein
MSSSLYLIEGIMLYNKSFVNGLAKKTAANLNKGSLNNGFVAVR